MFFFLSKTVGLLVNPAIWIFGLFLYALIHRYRRKLLLTINLILFLFFTNPIISSLAMSWLETDPVQLEKKYDIAIVLTGMLETSRVLEHQHSFGEAADRIIEAMKLYHEGKVDKILISGGSGLLFDQEFSESPLLADLAKQLKVAKDDIIIEPQSRNTFENAKFTAELIERNAISGDLLLITSSFHMKRSVACFKKQNLLIYPYPVDFRSADKYTDLGLWVPSGTALSTWNTINKELLGLLAYKLRGYI
jgi:uncharacterized SAM-binding protein YcdF (DUF218 family)